MKRTEIAGIALLVVALIVALVWGSSNARKIKKLTNQEQSVVLMDDSENHESSDSQEASKSTEETEQGDTEDVAELQARIEALAKTNTELTQKVTALENEAQNTGSDTEGVYDEIGGPYIHKSDADIANVIYNYLRRTMGVAWYREEGDGSSDLSGTEWREHMDYLHTLMTDEFWSASGQEEVYDSLQDDLRYGKGPYLDIGQVHPYFRYLSDTKCKVLVYYKYIGDVIESRGFDSCFYQEFTVIYDTDSASWKIDGCLHMQVVHSDPYAVDGTNVDMTEEGTQP